MTQITIDRDTLEQALEALLNTTGLPSTDARSFVNRIMSIRALRAAIANAGPTGWIAVSDRLPIESDGEVLVRMRDGRPEIAWATYWHGANTGFAEWTFRDQDEDETPTHWMPLPAAPKDTL